MTTITTELATRPISVGSFIHIGRVAVKSGWVEILIPSPELLEQSDHDVWIAALEVVSGMLPNWENAGIMLVNSISDGANIDAFDLQLIALVEAQGKSIFNLPLWIEA
jgi:hypothetical protein